MLFITAYSPKQFGGVVRDNIAIHEQFGFEVDLLTLYSVSGKKSNYISVFPRTREMIISDLRQKISKIPWIRRIYKRFHKTTSNPQVSSNYIRKGENTIVLEEESKPVVCNDLILSKITKEYDYFILYGWQDMMSSSTVEAIYDKYHKPIIIPCADMYQLTGNCFYIAGCDKYKNECRDCPVFADRSNKDQAYQNFLFKKRVYQKTGCYFLANTHLKKYFLKSGIIDENHILASDSKIDTDLYRPLNVNHCRKKFGLDRDKFYLLVRYISPGSPEYQRKGLHIFGHSLEIVFSHLTNEEKERVAVIFAGVREEYRMISYDFKTIAIGKLDIKDLIIAYNAASVFVCPSLDDAGPTMVIQSIACGTPVVAFDQGAALDVIEDGYNGFKAQVGDSEEFARCIEKIIRLSSTDYDNMRKHAREMSIRKNSFEAALSGMKKRFFYIDNSFQG